VVATLEVDDSFYRAQVEHELRAKMLRLRQKAAGILGDKDLLRQLLADSISTFCVLFRHAILLGGEEAPFEKRAIIEHSTRKFLLDASPFHTLLDLREGKIAPRDVVPSPLFEQYLKGIQTVVDSVDRLEK
jgi:hypothetical protein